MLGSLRDATTYFWLIPKLIQLNPEAVVSARQLRARQRLVSGGGGGRMGATHNPTSVPI